MNNDSSPTDLPRTENEDPPTTEPVDILGSVQRRQDEQTPAQKRAQAQFKKKFEFVSSLMNNLDILIYAELSILYYMEFVAHLPCFSSIDKNIVARSSDFSFESSTR